MRGVSFERRTVPSASAPLTGFSHITKDPIIQKYINVLRRGSRHGGRPLDPATSVPSEEIPGNGVTSLTLPQPSMHGTRSWRSPDRKNSAGFRSTILHQGRQGRFETRRAADCDHHSGRGSFMKAISGHYIKYAMRNAMDIATTGCSVKCSFPKIKTILDARIAYA